MAVVAIILERGLFDSAREGRHNFIALVTKVLRDAGHDVRLLRDTDAAEGLPDHTLVHMTQPVSRAGLTFRRAYHYPFWRIEATERRWSWDVARAEFPASSPVTPEAAEFQARWRKRIHGVGDIPDRPRDGHVYVPLQGKLTQHRSFQSMSPVEMIETVLRLDPDRPVIATLHPKETCSPAEQDALSRIAARYPRFSIDSRSPAQHLGACAYVVTQNSSVAFDGFLFDRPAILFARIDFHHIALSLHDMTAQDAFARIMSHHPSYAAYVHWFWQEMSINAGRPDASDRISARFRQLGWPV